jgi:hypothetical protein
MAVRRVVFDPTGTTEPVLRSVEPGPEKPEVCMPVQGAARPACSCAHLANPLDPEDELPDHICTPTMLSSVGNWQLETALGPTVPTLYWPLPQGHRAVVLVLRQFVYAPANARLRPALEREHTLEAIVDVLRKARADGRPMDRELLRHALAGARTLGWPERQLVLALARAAEGDDGWLARVLHGCGLPHTPAMLRYVRRRVAGEDTAEPPTCGVLVTTLVYGESLSDVGMEGRLGGHPFRWEWDARSGEASVLTLPARPRPLPPAFADVWFHDGRPVSTIGDDCAVRTDLLTRAADRVSRKHKAFLSRWRANVFADRRVWAMAWPSDGEPELLGYLEEALHPKHTEKLRKKVRRCGGNADTVISRHLSGAYRTVYKRRKEREMETRLAVVEPGYREKGTAALRARLKEGDAAMTK